MKLILTLGLILFAIQLVKSTDIPDYITVCHTSNPKFSDCVKSSVENLRLKLLSPIPEFNTPALDPLHVDDLQVFDKNQQNGFQVDLKDIVVNGAVNFNITRLKASVADKKLLLDLYFPELLVTGKYVLSGKILLLPLEGSGNFTGHFKNYKANVKVLGEIVNDNGVERYGIKKLSVKIIIGNGTITLDNLFNGDKTITDAINQTINDSYYEFATEVNPQMERAISKKAKEIGDNIIKRFTYDQLFPK